MNTPGQGHDDRPQTGGLFLGGDAGTSPPQRSAPAAPPSAARPASRQHAGARASTVRQPIRSDAAPRRDDSTRGIAIVAVGAAALGIIALVMLRSAPPQPLPPPPPVAADEPAPPPRIVPPVGTVVRPLAPTRSTTLAPEKNLVANASFEQVANEKPIGWGTQHFGGEAVWSVDPAGGRRGSVAARISSLTGADASWSVTVAVKPNSTFLCKGWVRCENVSGPGRGAQLHLDGGGLCSDPIVGTSGWRQLQFTFESGNQTQIRINCLYGGWGKATGTAWFDDIEVTELFSGK